MVHFTKQVINRFIHVFFDDFVQMFIAAWSLPCPKFFLWGSSADIATGCFEPWTRHRNDSTSLGMTRNYVQMHSGPLDCLDSSGSLGSGWAL
jgi:hypothetical protein